MDYKWNAIIEMDPTPKASVRVRFSPNGRVRSYLPKKTHKAYEIIGCQVVEQAPLELFTGPLKVRIILFILRPKSVKTKYPISKRTGDVDNHSKTILDAITKTAMVWHDDSQVVDLDIKKRYADECEPHFIISVDHV